MKSILFTAFVLLLLSVIGCQKEPSIDPPVVIDTIPVTDTTVLLRILSIEPDSAKAGDTIVVTGTGFNSIGTSGTITINGSPLSIINRSDTTLTLKLPANFTSGPISIVSADTNIISLVTVTVLPQNPVDSAAVWTQRASIQFEGVFPSATIFSKGFAIDGKGYFLTSIFRQFDPVLNQWSTKPAPPLPLNTGFAFVLKGKLYAGCSADINGNLDQAKQVWQYDPASEAWTRKADFPGTIRIQPFSFSTTTFGYIGGGQQPQPDSIFTDFWRYDADSDSWKQMQDYPKKSLLAFEQYTGFTINNTGYVFEAGAGSVTNPTGYTHLTTDLWQYNEGSNTWVQKASFDKQRHFVSPTIFSIGTKAYLTYGLPEHPIQEGVNNNFWEYDATANVWVKRTDVPGVQRFFGSSFSIGNKGYVGLGTKGDFSDLHSDFWEYTPE